ncbi:MAG: hypothetical protein CVU84_12610 [Firmicutes bacterium HGW-Firmicutes-1]|jgi:hypothetical protein|nr:MAG: hypothetical protein CVU84_12610 [Firmicutes bacterium HGW-Firmicutes-1]
MKEVKKLCFKRLKRAISLVVLLSMVLSLNNAVGASNQEMNWQSIDDFRSFKYRDITISDKGQYLLVGSDGLIGTSTDLKNWDYTSINESIALYGAAWGNGKYVVAGDTSTIGYSSDAIKWEFVKFDQDIIFQDVKWVKDKFIAVGAKYPLKGRDDVRYIMESKDGINWNTVLENKGEFSWNTIKYINDTYVVYGIWKDIAISEDGIAWTVRAISNSGSDINDIIWDGSKYVAVGENSKVYTSSDLSNWTEISVNIKPGYYLHKVTMYKNAYYTVLSDNNNNVILSSTNLTEWNPINDKLYAEISSFIENQGNLIAVGWHNTIIKTSDGINWDSSEQFAPIFLKVIWNGNEFLAIGNDGTIVKSDDGISWKKYYSGIKETLVDVVWTGEKYTALSITYKDYNIDNSKIYQSNDGVTWSSLGSINQENIETLYYFDNKYFLLGRKGEILTSNDAKNWTKQISNTSNWLEDMTWNGKQFVSVGMFGTIIISNDGLKWSIKNSGVQNDLKKVIWTGKNFFAAGNWSTILSFASDTSSVNKKYANQDITFENLVWNGKECLLATRMGEIYTTKDGKKINTISSNSLSSPRSVAWNGEAYVMVGDDGRIAIHKPSDIIKVKVDEVPVIFDVAPQIISGHTMIPARAVFEKMGATVTWDSKTETVTVTKADTVIKVKVNSSTANVNGKSKKLEAPAVNIDGRIFTPARFVAEELGAKVDWKNNTVFIEQ